MVQVQFLIVIQQLVAVEAHLIGWVLPHKKLEDLELLEAVEALLESLITQEEPEDLQLPKETQAA
tara:strand:- start:461 stop:655 length:195 start_codon:yes stop_codon:yes gene_type:complete